MLFYLAFGGGWVFRDEISFFLRPDADKKTGQQYLRKLLNGARQLPWAHGLKVEARQLLWQVPTDVAAFREAVRAERWFEAVQLYRGPFLQGLNTSSWPSYEAWIEAEREALENLHREATLNYARDLEGSSRHGDAVVALKNLLARDSLDEEALHSYLLNMYLSGRRDHALRTAHEFYRKLEEELGFSPNSATQELVAAIRAKQPLEKRVVERKYGRRRDDRRDNPKDEHQELRDLLNVSGARLLTLTTAEGHDTLVFTRRVPDSRLALDVVVELAEKLLTEGHHVRALELLMLVLAHPACDPPRRKKVTDLQQKLHPRTRPV